MHKRWLCLKLAWVPFLGGSVQFLGLCTAPLVGVTGPLIGGSAPFTGLCTAPLVGVTGPLIRWQCPIHWTLHCSIGWGHWPIAWWKYPILWTHHWSIGADWRHLPIQWGEQNPIVKRDWSIHWPGQPLLLDGSRPLPSTSRTIVRVSGPILHRKQPKKQFTMDREKNISSVLSHLQLWPSAVVT